MIFRDRSHTIQNHIYLIKDVYQYQYENVTGSKKINVPSTGLVSSWMWYLQRNDVNMRNEWSNYTNWVNPDIPPYSNEYIYSEK